MTAAASSFATMATIIRFKSAIHCRRGLGWVTPDNRRSIYCWAKRNVVSITLYRLNRVKLTPSDPVSVADTHRPKSSEETLDTCCAQGPRMARTTPPGFHARGASMHIVAVSTRAWPKCSRKVDAYASWRPAFIKSVFGSWIAIASTDLTFKLTQRVCSSAELSLLEMPLAFTDQTRKEPLDLVATESPQGSFGAIPRGGGREAGIPPTWTGASDGAGSVATK
jgi:hypothetical protein